MKNLNLNVFNNQKIVESVLGEILLCFSANNK